jgi:hypothetical protein
MTSAYRLSRSVAAAAAVALALCGELALAADVKLTGANEVPPVDTPATGEAAIMIAADGSVTGSIKTTAIDGTMAHIHLGAVGKNGGVIVPLAKGADGSWMVPPGAKLTAEQLASYKAGDLYVNVHSEAHKGGEIRAQLTP